MSLKESLKKGFENVKKDWKEESKRKKERKEKFNESYQAEKLSQASKIGREQARIEGQKKIKELKTPAKAFEFGDNPFGGGFFSEPKSRQSNRKKKVHKRKREKPLFDMDNLF